MIIGLPPSSDLAVTGVAVAPGAASPGESLQIQWSVANIGTEPASGNWSDSVYLSADATWDITDRPLGRASFNGTLQPGESYSGALDARLPSVMPGQYRIIVRADIFNQIYEDQGELNNRTASPDTLDVNVDEIVLGVPYQTTLSSGQERLLRITVPQNQTLQVTLDTDSPLAVNELFLRHATAPTTAAYDAAYEGGLGSNLRALVPSTKPGTYYVLLRGFSEPADDTPVTVLTELLPFSITEVRTDVGGDSRYVTTTETSCPWEKSR